MNGSGPTAGGSTRLRHIVVVALLGAFVAACGGSAAGPEQNDRYAPVSGAADEGGSPTSAPAPQGANAVRDDALIVRTGSMQLQVKDVPAALRSAREIVEAAGGYIGASRQSQSDDKPVAEVTYRIPVDRWEATLDAMRALAVKVLDEQIEAAEVTGQVVDLDARIRNLQASEKALQAIAERADKVADVLAVMSQLTEVRGQIEQLTAEKQNLQDRAALSTLTVTFGSEVVAVTEAAKDWDPAAEVDQAAASLVNLLQAVAGAGIWFAIVWLPILVVLLVLALVVRLVLRRTRLLERRAPEPTFPTAPPPAEAG
jgi:hypothetical protein